MGFIITLYCSVGEVDAYAKEHGKEVWLCLSDDEKKSAVERANRQIHAWHGQKMLWKAGDFNFPCILQSIYIAKNGMAMDMAETATNASKGAFNDTINNIEAGAEVHFDEWAMAWMKRVMQKNRIERQPRFARG